MKTSPGGRVAVALYVTALVTMATSGEALADPIEGTWLTKSGEKAAVTRCGEAYCFRIITGKYAGRQIGKVTRKGERYVGLLTDPKKNRAYSGSATVSGHSLTLTGCALKIFCKSQTWNKL